MNDSEEVSVYINKEDFIKKMQDFTKDLVVVLNRYIEEGAKDPNDPWIVKQIRFLAEDIKSNNEMIRRAQIEDGYMLHYIDSSGVLSIRRCSKEEYDSIYKRKPSLSV